MKYSVQVSGPARRDIDKITRWWAENRDARQAERWYVGILTALRGLARSPTAHELAFENQFTPRELRQLNYGVRKKPTHRALYTVDGNTVVILRVRHLSQDNLGAEEVELGD